MGPPMYIITPYDRADNDEEDPAEQGAVRNAVNTTKSVSWIPNTISPEQVVLNRAVVLAQRSHVYMMNQLSSFGEDSCSDWCAMFQESPQSFHSYDVLLRVNPDLIVDHGSSSTIQDLDPKPMEGGEGGGANDGQDLMSSYTISMVARNEGPKILRKKVYRNLVVTSKGEGNDGSSGGTILPVWDPVRSVVESLRVNFGRYALFFYNDLAPEVIGLVWRPQTFNTSSFSAMTSEYARPVEQNQDYWTNDTLVCRNSTDLLREMSPYFHDVITTVKVSKGNPEQQQLQEQPAQKKQKLSS
jgi:U3 small nucleolar RNA-associated protein 22